MSWPASDISPPPPMAPAAMPISPLRRVPHALAAGRRARGDDRLEAGRFFEQILDGVLGSLTLDEISD